MDNARLNGKSLKITLHIPYIELFDPPQKMDNLQYWSLKKQQYHGNSIGQLIFLFIVCDTSCLIFDGQRLLKSPEKPSLQASSVASWMSVSLAEGQSFRNRPSSIRREYLNVNHPEMAGSKKKCPATSMLPQTGWNMKTKILLTRGFCHSTWMTLLSNPFLRWCALMSLHSKRKDMTKYHKNAPSLLTPKCTAFDLGSYLYNSKI